MTDKGIRWRRRSPLRDFGLLLGAVALARLAQRSHAPRQPR